MKGRVVAVFGTLVDGKVVRSPDNPGFTTPGAPGGVVAFQVHRSKGFEDMASSKDGSKLYALLKGALRDADAKDDEALSGKPSGPLEERRWCAYAALPRRRAMKPTRPKPASIIARAPGSGTGVTARTPMLALLGAKSLIWLLLPEPSRGHTLNW